MSQRTHLIPVSRVPSRLPVSALPRFLLSNCRSVLGKLDSLKSTVLRYDVNVVCLSETWLNSTNSLLSDSAFPDFVSYHTFRNDRQGGGISILINNKYESSLVKKILTPDAELLAILISNCSTGYCHLVVCIYRPPSGSTKLVGDVLDTFLCCRPPSNYTTILGDFNRFNTQDIELLYGLDARVSFHTRGCATLDQILSNTKNYQTPQRILPIGSSDHVSIGLFLTVKLEGLGRCQKSQYIRQKIASHGCSRICLI